MSPECTFGKNHRRVDSELSWRHTLNVAPVSISGFPPLSIILEVDPIPISSDPVASGNMEINMVSYSALDEQDTDAEDNGSRPSLLRVKRCSGRVVVSNHLTVSLIDIVESPQLP